VHVSFRAPAERWLDDGNAPTSLLDLEGFRLMPIGGRLHVVGWPEDQAPQQPDGLPPAAVYPELWRVEGFPVVVSLVANLLRGPPGSPVELQLRWRDGIVTRHMLQRPEQPRAGDGGSPLGHLDSGFWRWRTRGNRPFGWIEVATFDDKLQVDKVVNAIDAARGKGGLVLDLRRNLGGRWSVTREIVEHFLHEPIDLVFVQPADDPALGGLISVEVFSSSTWLPHAPLFDQPLVVLTSSLTASMAEHAARVLQQHAGAIVIGERTVGAEAGIREFTGPDDGLLKFGALRIVDRTGVGLQAEGVPPDISVRLTLDDLERLGPDAAARDWDERLSAAAAAALRERTPR
jgi:carboxyl-terminal processing protease